MTKELMIIKDWDAETIAGMIDNEGLDYFFMNYLSAADITDAELRESVEGWRDQRADAIARLEALGVVL